MVEVKSLRRESTATVGLVSSFLDRGWVWNAERLKWICDFLTQKGGIGGKPLFLRNVGESESCRVCPMVAIEYACLVSPNNVLVKFLDRRKTKVTIFLYRHPMLTEHFFEWFFNALQG